MSTSEQTYEELKDELNLLNDLYYNNSEQPISDAEYDVKYQLFREMEKKQGWIASDSPTIRVGSKVTGVLIKHTEPMLSLDNTFNANEMFHFFSGCTEQQFSLEPKVDGMSGTILYRNGGLISALTRGDGEHGEDITAKVRLIKTVPLTIPIVDSNLIEVRGEFHITREAFARINIERIKNGLKPYKTARNATAGTFSSNDPFDVQKNEIKFIAYGTTNWSGLDLIQQMGRVGELGFRTVTQFFFQGINDLAETIDSYWLSREKLFPFDIDGLVIKLIKPELIKKLGKTAKFPKWAVARKWNDNIVTANVIDIISQVGRTGAVTPVAILEPILIGGVLVERATLHNFNEIARLGIGIGSTVNMIRSGEVIPKILNIVPNGKHVDPVSEPNKCPVCKSKLLYQKEEDAILYCVNKKCKGILVARIEHFCSRKGMDIENLSEKTIEKLVDNDSIKVFGDIFRITKKTLMDTDGFAITSVLNLLEAIKRSKTPQLERFIYSLGIPEVGEKTSKLIASYFGSMDKFIKTDLTELKSLRGIAETSGSSILNHIQDPERLAEIIDLMQFIDPIFNTSVISKALEGKVFCISGSMQMDRDSLTAYLEKYSATVTTSVSKKTTLLLIGPGAGDSKVNAAIKNKVKMLEVGDLLIDQIAEAIETELGIVLRATPT